MPLRCLLFSSDEGMVQPIWQALTDLGIEGEYCRSAVDAVERVTTQLFQIVITDWEDQPEAAFLLKTARDLKAAHRPLTLAIVSNDGSRPEALQAGANSILLKPIRAEQVRDTMRTACELLRAKVQPSSKPAAPVVPQEKAPQAAMAAAAAASTTSFGTPARERIFRAGDFLQSSSSTPGAQFDTEADIQKGLDEAPADPVDALTDLEPTAAAVEDAPAESARPEEALTGWAALQARLGKTTPSPVHEASPKSELLSYEQTPSYGGVAAPATDDPAKREEARSEAVLFDYMAGKAEEPASPKSRVYGSGRKLWWLGTFVVIGVIMLATPLGRHALQTGFRTIVGTGLNWLNPPPARVPQAVVQHDSFGQSGDEYKLPVSGNIPDATTDTSQIRVLPVVDPTAKAEKGAGANTGQAQATPIENNPADPNLSVETQSPADRPESHPQDPPATGARNLPETVTTAAAVPSASPPRPEANAEATQTALPSARPATPPVRKYLPPPVSAGGGVGIPPSLKSQIAAMTPASGGAKPVEAAMSSIEPVKLPESAVRELLAQPVDPEYPAAAKGSGQKGSVVLQILVGRDGAVQDAKFMQGSLIFARAAIDAVKQWRFRSYMMNGRAVAVQSAITLNFKPPA